MIENKNFNYKNHSFYKLYKMDVLEKRYENISKIIKILILFYDILKTDNILYLINKQFLSIKEIIEKNNHLIIEIINNKEKNDQLNNIKYNPGLQEHYYNINNNSLKAFNLIDEFENKLNQCSVIIFEQIKKFDIKNYISHLKTFINDEPVAIYRIDEFERFENFFLNFFLIQFLENDNSRTRAIILNLKQMFFLNNVEREDDESIEEYNKKINKNFNQLIDNNSNDLLEQLLNIINLYENKINEYIEKNNKNKNDLIVNISKKYDNIITNDTFNNIFDLKKIKDNKDFNNFIRNDNNIENFIKKNFYEKNKDLSLYNINKIFDLSNRALYIINLFNNIKMLENFYSSSMKKISEYTEIENIFDKIEKLEKKYSYLISDPRIFNILSYSNDKNMKKIFLFCSEDEINQGPIIGNPKNQDNFKINLNTFLENPYIKEDIKNNIKEDIFYKPNIIGLMYTYKHNKLYSLSINQESYNFFNLINSNDQLNQYITYVLLINKEKVESNQLKIFIQKLIIDNKYEIFFKVISTKDKIITIKENMENIKKLTSEENNIIGLLNENKNLLLTINFFVYLYNFLKNIDKNYFVFTSNYGTFEEYIEILKQQLTYLDNLLLKLKSNIQSELKLFIENQKKINNDKELQMKEMKEFCEKRKENIPEINSLQYQYKLEIMQNEKLVNFNSKNYINIHSEIMQILIKSEDYNNIINNNFIDILNNNFNNEQREQEKKQKQHQLLQQELQKPQENNNKKIENLRKFIIDLINDHIILNNNEDLSSILEIFLEGFNHENNLKIKKEKIELIINYCYEPEFEEKILNPNLVNIIENKDIIIKYQ